MYMDDKNSKRENVYYLQQVCLDSEKLICCLVADYFLIQRGKVPFASALYYILLNGMNDQTYNQNLLRKKNKLNKEGKVIMTNAAQDYTNKNNFQYGRTYYFDKSGMPIDECEGSKVRSECKKIIETCCRIQIPKGFKLDDCSPGMCFNLSGLSCIKNPIMQKVWLPVCEYEYPKQCEVVAGYEIRSVGEVDFSVSLPICPIKGFCFSKHSHVCSSAIVPVNEVISHACCPKPCSCNESCVDWKYAYFCTALVEDDCGLYIRVKMGVALEYTGDCECDEE